MKKRITPAQSQQLDFVGILGNLTSHVETKLNYVLIPEYTVGDLIEMLPKKIYVDEQNMIFELVIRWCVGSMKWSVGYLAIDPTKGFASRKTAKELCDALHAMLFWVHSHGYFQIPDKPKTLW